jgi:protein TonB
MLIIIINTCFGRIESMQAVIQFCDRQEPAGIRVRSSAGLLVILLHVSAIVWLLVHSTGVIQPASEQTMMVMMIPPPEQIVPVPQQAPPPRVEQPAVIKSTRTIAPEPSAPVVPPEPVNVPAAQESIAEPVATVPIAEPTAAPATPAVPLIPNANVRMAYLNNKMVYPDHLRRRGVQGKSVVKVLVSPEGRVLQIELLRSSGNTELDSAAIKGVRDWKFAPFTGAGAVPSSAIVPINFELR